MIKKMHSIFHTLFVHVTICWCTQAVSFHSKKKKKKRKKRKNSRGLFVQAASDSQALLRCLREVPLNALVSVPVKGLEFAPAFGPSVDGVVIDPGDPEDQDFTLQVDTINTLNNILLRKDVVAKLSRYSSYDSLMILFRFLPRAHFHP